MRQFALSVFAVVALLPAVSQAQLFPRLFGGKQTQVGSACPGGVCPTAAPASTYRSVGAVAAIAAPVKAIQNRAGHWSYPGSIDSHLEGTHGVSTAGMSHAEKLALHDSLHEGTATAAHRRSNYPAVSATSGYGSLGSIAVHSQASQVVSGFGSAGSRVSGFGSAGGLSVGSLDRDGLVITSVSAPITMPSFTPTIQAALAPIDATKIVPVPVVEVRASREFKQSLRAAISQARRDGKITIGEALELQTASYSPAFVRNAERLAIIQMVASGENPELIPRTEDGRVDTAGINWAELLKFLQVFLPILLELLKGLGL